VLLEAALRSPSIQSKIPPELYSPSRTVTAQSRLDALLNAVETNANQPAYTIVDKTKLEVKANLAPFIEP
jgi:hypothetical protein